jgi:hypothetical protein
MNGPPACTIGQGSSSISSASPASTDVNSGYDNDNLVSATTFFTNTQQPHARQSPTSGLHQENRSSNGQLYPAHANAVRKRHQAVKPSIYDSVTRPYDYTNAFHRLFLYMQTKYATDPYKKAVSAMNTFRPVLMAHAHHLDEEDLTYSEKNLQRSLVTLLQNFVEVGIPCLILRRSGEVVGMNKEFEILTGWKREVLLGHVPNANANTGPQTIDSPQFTQMNRMPTVLDQEPDPGPHPISILELMDQASGAQYLADFADLCHQDPLGKGHRRVNLFRYLTKEDIGQMADRAANLANGMPLRPEPAAKHEDPSVHQGETAMRNLGANGLIDAMIMWHIKRDNFDMPMLIAMQVSSAPPVLINL